MARTICWLAMPVLLLAASGQSPQFTAGKTAGTLVEAEVRFLDSSNLRTLILQEKLEIVTKYGTLTVPMSDIVKIDFGICIAADVQKTVSDAMENLGSENYKTREQALRQLVDLGPKAYPQLLKAAKSDLPEVATRVAMALDKICAKHPAANLRLREDDIITTALFQIIGKVAPPTLKVKNDIFGELELKLAQVRSIRCVTAASNEMEIEVDAAKYGSATNQWLETNFEVQSGIQIVITATGIVNLWPQDVGQGGAVGGGIIGGGMGASGGAAGGGMGGGAAGGGMGGGAAGGGMGGGGDQGDGAGGRLLAAIGAGAQPLLMQGGYLCGPQGYNANGPSPAGTQFRAGTLLGRVGRDGAAPFVIGERFDGVPARDGKLYLHIVPSPWNNVSIGVYRVKIMPRGELGDD